MGLHTRPSGVSSCAVLHGGAQGSCNGWLQPPAHSPARVAIAFEQSIGPNSKRVEPVLRLNLTDLQQARGVG